MYTLVKPTYGGRCDKCHRPVAFIFMGKTIRRWQKRCRHCAEKMVQEGKAVFKE